jgi:hypothetical protein
MRAAVAILALVILTLPVLAQQRLPRRSPSEQQLDSINRSIGNQERQIGQQQQNQFEINQLRQDMNRQQSFPTLTGPNAPGPCAPNAIRC